MDEAKCILCTECDAPDNCTVPVRPPPPIFFFFLNDPATPEFYPLPHHAPLPIPGVPGHVSCRPPPRRWGALYSEFTWTDVARSSRSPLRSPPWHGPVPRSPVSPPLRRRRVRRR